MATILGIESTCDETAAAVVIDGRRVVSNIVTTQIALHEKYRGVVPEIASRAHVENILPVIRQALDDTSLTLDRVDAIAVAYRPGLIGSLLIGVTAAKTLAWATITSMRTFTACCSIPISPSPCPQSDWFAAAAILRSTESTIY